MSWRVRALNLAIALFALEAMLGCSVLRTPAGEYRGSIACVNITGPGFSWTCPETLQAPPLPDSQRPPGQ